MLKFKDFISEIKKSSGSEKDEISSVRRAIADLKQKMNDPGYSDAERKQHKDWHDKEVKRLKLYGVDEAQENGLKKACWKGYTAIGTKKKNGKTVPNCVPEGFEESEFPKGIFLKDYLKPETYGNAEDHAKDAQKHKSDYLNKSQDPKFGPQHEDTIKSKALWKWHNAQKHYHEGKSNSQSWYSSNMDEFEKLRRAHALLANERENKSLKKEEYMIENDSHPEEWDDKGTKWKLTHIGTTTGEGKGGRPGSKIHFYAAEHPIKKGAYRLVVKGHTGIMRGTTTSNPFLDPNSENDVNIKKKFSVIQKG